MDAAQFFLLRYEPLHAVMTDRLFADLGDAQLRARPQGQNSIVWMLWHVARAEDIGVNRFAYDRQQVFDEGDWGTRIGAGRRDLGTAMTSDEVPCSALPSTPVRSATTGELSATGRWASYAAMALTDGTTGSTPRGSAGRSARPVTTGRTSTLTASRPFTVA